MKDLIIPNDVTILNDYTFDGCSGLNSVSIPNKVSSIGICAFRGCTGLTSITIPNNATEIGSGAFESCSSLTFIDVPNSVTTLGDVVFRGCSSLTTLTLGSGLNSIGYKAFSECKELTNVYCYAEKVPTSSGSNIFEGSYVEYATLHVPLVSVNEYKAAEDWKKFKEIVGLDGSIPETPKCEKPSIVYKDGKLEFESATEDVEFISDITDADIKKNYAATVLLTATYNISVYATKSGYDNSDVATATLCWIDAEPKTEGITSGVANVRAQAVLIQNNDGFITINGIEDGTRVCAYTLNGVEESSTISRNGSAILSTNAKPGNTVVVKLGDKSVKVLMK